MIPAVSAGLLVPLALLTLLALALKARALEYWLLLSISSGLSYFVRAVDMRPLQIIGLLLQAGLCAFGIVRLRQTMTETTT